MSLFLSHFYDKIIIGSDIMDDSIDRKVQFVANLLKVSDKESNELKIYILVILLIMMIPSQVSSVGFLEMCNEMHWTNQYWVLIVPGIAAPATFFYMIQHLRATLPLDLVEASRMDGSSEFMTFNRIVLPIMKPALAVQLIFSFVASWNNLYLPTLLITKTELKTLPTMLALLRSADFANMDNGLIYMVIFISIFPVMLVYLFLSRAIIKGVTSGSVKG